MLSLLQKIISVLEDIWLKIRKLDDYWSHQYTLTATYNNNNTSLASATSVTATLTANTLRVLVYYNMAVAKSAGTSIKGRVCHVTITGIQDLIPSGATPGGTNGINSTTGPLCTGTMINMARTDDDTLDIDIYLGGVVGGGLTTSGNYILFFNALVPRLIPIS